MTRHSPPSHRTALAVRSLLATVETVGFATTVHVQAGGHRPGVVQLVILAAVVFAGALALLQRRVGLRAAAVAVVGAQVVLHEGFALLSPGADPSAMHAAGTAMPGMSMPAASPSAGSDLLVLDSRMVLNHVVIALVTVLVLACQDQALTLIADVVRLRTQQGNPCPPLRPVAVESSPRAGLRSALLATAPRRGPPRWVLLTP